jgi:hypothetical protein
MQRIRKALVGCYLWMHHTAHKGERPVHLAYFVLVFVEAHGFYGIAAGVCAALILLSDAPPHA